MTIAGGSCSESAASGGRRERVVVLCLCRQPGDETCRVSLLVQAPRFCFVFCEFLAYRLGCIDPFVVFASVFFVQSVIPCRSS